MKKIICISIVFIIIIMFFDVAFAAENIIYPEVNNDETTSGNNNESIEDIKQRILDEHNKQFEELSKENEAKANDLFNENIENITNSFGINNTQDEFNKLQEEKRQEFEEKRENNRKTFNRNALNCNIN